MEKLKVTFYPYNQTIEVEKGKTILSAAAAGGIYINSACGGNGICGRCKVILKKGVVSTKPSGMLSVKERENNYYLACLTTVQSDLEVEVPPESRLSFDNLSQEELSSQVKNFSKPTQQSSYKSSIAEAFKNLPLVFKLYLELPPPNLDDHISDLERLYRQIRMYHDIPIMQTGLANIRQLAETLRLADWKVTVTLGKRDGTTEIILIEPYDTSQRNYGLAFDIGTTTICGQLVNLNTKEVLSTKMIYNKQAVFGPDVITRIVYAQQDNGLEKLHQAATEGINEMIQKFIQEKNIDLNDITCILCSGNTTMIHLLLRLNPTYIRKEPYVPVANFIPAISAGEVGIKINPRGLLFCVPSVSSYVGGDAVAGVLACGMDKEKELCLLIDIGTNGELVLGNRDFLISCAASAGPAFEGSGVTSGMRATVGAIQKTMINSFTKKVEFSTIGGLKPCGICGSGYIDILAQMFKAGILDRTGKIINQKDWHIRDTQYGKEFVLVEKQDTAINADIVINEVDIENLKRAKAAIFAGASILLRHMGLDFKDVKKIFIAGGFGNYLDIQSAQIIGLLPDLEKERFIFVGNSSLYGARKILLSCADMDKAKEIACKITYFELSVEPGYMEEYTAALFFPHTDLSRFSNINI